MEDLYRFCRIFVNKCFILNQALVKDMKQKLLNGMKDMLSHGMKVKAIIAWGWFIRLLGSQALKNRHLVNDMLKIPEHTFADHDPQVQIASQVFLNEYAFLQIWKIFPIVDNHLRK